MAPKKAAASGAGKITSFFSRFTIPKDEIVVASPSNTSTSSLDKSVREDADAVGASRRASHQSAPSRTDSHTPKLSPNRGRLPKSSSSSSSPLSGSQSSTLKRGRGRPPKSSTDSLPKTPQRNDISSAGADTRQAAASHHSPASRLNVNPLSGLSDVTPTKDSPYRDSSSSTSSSKRRRVVMGPPSQHPTPTQPPTPSPLSVRTKSPAIIAPLKLPIFTKPSQPAASFSSSLSSLPLSSVPASTASSKRIMRDGMQAIANSDSEDSDDSSGPELADVSAFFVSKRRKLTPPVEATPAPVPRKQYAKLSDVVQRAEFSLPMVKTAPRKLYKNSLADLAKEHEAWKKSEATIASLESAVEESKKRQEEATAQEALGLDVRGGALLDAAADEESRERMLKALERTEALNNANLYYFFLDDQPQYEASAFPVDSLPEAPWTQLYKDDASRAKACISGFAAQLVEKCPLPLAVTSWLAQQLSYEKNETLCEAYVDILMESSRHHPESVSDTIASISSMYRTKSLFELKWKQSVRKSLPSGLRFYMQVVQCCAPAADSVVKDAPPSWSAAAFLDLAMINIDENVRTDLGLSLTVTASIESMLDSLNEEQIEMLIPEVIGALYRSGDLADSIKYRIITSLPGKTAPAYRIRRRLALEYFSRSKNYKSANKQDWFASILKTLRTKRDFDVSGNTDYGLLMLLVQLLDIAVSAGFTPWSELHPPQASVPRGPFDKAPSLSPAAKAHNHYIDLLVLELQNIHGRVYDSGINHLGRTEVKSALERLISRLEHSVRTKLKPKKSIFGKPQLNQAKLNKNLLAKAKVIDEKQLSRNESPAADFTMRSENSTPSANEQLPTPKASAMNVDQVMEDVASGHDGSHAGESEEEDFQTCYDISQPPE